MNSNRDHVKEYFLEWSEGKLDEEKMRIVEHHLEVCESCATYYQTLQPVVKNPKKDQLPVLNKDPYLPVRIRNRTVDRSDPAPIPLWGLSKSLTGSLIIAALLLGFLIGQQLVYLSDYDQEERQSISVTELYYEGMVQPNLGTRFEKILTEMEGD